MELDMDDLPLPALFEHARKIHSMASESTLDQETLVKAIEMLRRCDHMISTLGLFSSNETKDDVSTVNLKYLLVSFFIGELTEKFSGEDRLHVIKQSLDQFKEFISTCEALELVPEEETKGAVGASNDTMAGKREKKISRFKRQRAAESKLQELKERRERRGRSLKAAALSSRVEAVEEDLLDEDDGEEEREAWITTISLALCKAFDMLEMLKKEEGMLSAVRERMKQEGSTEFDKSMLDERARKAEIWHRNAALRSQYSKPAQPITCATFAQDVIEGRAKASQVHEHKHQPLIFGPASLIGSRPTSERERLSAQVFQPSHRLPTMSIEEAGLREMEMMNNWQEMNARLASEVNSSWHLEKNKAEDDEDSEAAEEKARAWDDWKDDNPRGAGNTKLTPCG
ncbi:2A phosphatase associated protein of 46 kD [Wolffia australiana]